MGKYAWPIILISLGAAGLSYSKMTSNEAGDNKGLDLIAGILVAIGALMVLWRSYSK